MNIHINWSRMELIRRSVRRCPTEGRRRRFFGWFQSWYGWHFTCLGCGEQWADGERCERPFAPGWRKRNIERAKKLWREAKPIYKSAREMIDAQRKEDVHAEV